LAELKVEFEKIREFLFSLRFYNKECVNPRGKRGGLILCWKNGVDVEIVMVNHSMVSGLVFSDPGIEPWLLSVVYGPPRWVEKKRFWLELQQVGESFGGAWVCITV
jgi:hypothetical protein